MKHLLVFLSLWLCLTASAQTADPTATTYTVAQCSGSLMPYRAVTRDLNCPDTLTPVHITYVGRHGARYPASSAHARLLEKTLLRADSLGTLTPAGRALLDLDREVIRRSTDRWGALDSLGMAEMRGIASRMMGRFFPLFKEGTVVNAVSSYSPRVMMSMYEFTHQLDRLNNRLEFVTSTGRQNSLLCRPFDTPEFSRWLRDGDWAQPYDSLLNATFPTAPIERAAGKNFPWNGDGDRLDASLAEYYVLAGCAAMGIAVDPLKFVTPKEYNAMWGCFNLRQYLQRSASVLGSSPADIAGPLLENIIQGLDAAAEGTSASDVDLVFGHAETLMPLLSLMHLKGCYYLTNYFDTVGLNWRDWDIVPMGANLQLALMSHPRSGRFYLLALLNEEPVALLPGDTRLYVPWGEAREYLTRCLPLF